MLCIIHDLGYLVSVLSRAHVTILNLTTCYTVSGVFRGGGALGHPLWQKNFFDRKKIGKPGLAPPPPCESTSGQRKFGPPL